VDCIR